MTAPCNQLISISDLEGCLLESLSKQKQHTVLCAETTFNAIESYLKSNSGNHIAFLGDYFDNGPHMVYSIKRIVQCKTNYVSQVHIILGNRDINKMRLAVEKDIDYVTNPPKNEKILPVWRVNTPFEPFKKENLDKVKVSDNTALGRTKYLLAKTYGASNLLQNISRELYKQSDRESEEKALELFTSIFLKDDGTTKYTPAESDFVTDCIQLFSYGKIMTKVQVGDKFVLLSHGGSFSNRIFTRANISIIEDIISNDNQYLLCNCLNYYEKMEVCRKIIDIPEPATGDPFDPSIAVDIDKVIDYYNSFYMKVRDYLKATSIKQVEQIRDNYSYHMLQANDKAASGSPIANCVLSANCNTYEQIKNLPEFLAGYLQENNIHIISHGHIPFCATVPLIYKNGDIIYVSNDTSNGNRPLYDGQVVELQNVPLSLITTTGVGICSLNDDGTINEPDTTKSIDSSEFIIHAYRNSNSPEAPADPNFYRALVTSYNYADNFPTHIHINTFFEPEGKFTPLKKYTAPPSLERSISQETDPENLGEQARTGTIGPPFLNMPFSQEEHPKDLTDIQDPRASIPPSLKRYILQGDEDPRKQLRTDIQDPRASVPPSLKKRYILQGDEDPRKQLRTSSATGGKKSKKYRKSISCLKCGNSCCKCSAKSKKRNKKSKKTRKSRKARKTMKKLNQDKRKNRHSK